MFLVKNNTENTKGIIAQILISVEPMFLRKQFKIIKSSNYLA